MRQIAVEDVPEVVHFHEARIALNQTHHGFPHELEILEEHAEKVAQWNLFKIN